MDIVRTSQYIIGGGAVVFVLALILAVIKGRAGDRK